MRIAQKHNNKMIYCLIIRRYETLRNDVRSFQLYPAFNTSEVTNSVSSLLSLVAP